MHEARLTDLISPESIAPPSSRYVTVGVAITAYQIAHLLPRAVESVVTQTDPPDHIVVCDDGSSDDVKGALAQYLDRVTLIQQENRGPAGAKNTAIEACGTEYAILLDGDDTWDARRVERLRAAAQGRPDLALLTTDAFVNNGTGVADCTYYESAEFHIDMGDVRASILRNNFIFSHAMVRVETWRRSGRFNETLPSAVDRDCWTRMILDGALPGIIMEPLATRHIRPDSVSRNRYARYDARARMFRGVLSRQDLSEREAMLAQRGLRNNHAMALMIAAREAIVSGAADGRQRCWAVVREPTCPWPSRLKALALWATPAIGRYLLGIHENNGSDPRNE